MYQYKRHADLVRVFQVGMRLKLNAVSVWNFYGSTVLPITNAFMLATFPFFVLLYFFSPSSEFHSSRPSLI